MAPKQRNERLIRGDYDSLSEEEKKKAVKLNGYFFIRYPLELSADQFKMKAKYANKSESTLKTARNSARTALKEELTINDFKKNNLKTSQFMVNASTLLEKDWRLFKRASPEMLWVKKSLAALNNVLESGIGTYINEQGIFDAEGYIERINKAYQEFFDAAQNYLDSRNPSSIAGKRRYRRVSELLNAARKSKIDNYNLFTSIKDGAVEFDNISAEKRETLNAYNIINEVNSAEAVQETVVWQNEGNSTDVYRLKLQGDDNNFYYLKENLPFLNYNFEGFINRRLRQLEASKNNRPGKPGADPAMEEARLKNITEKDYDNCEKLLRDFLNTINNASAANKQKVTDKLVNYLGHDFDKIFKDFELYNKAASYPLANNEVSLDTLIEKSSGLERQAYLLRKKILIEEGRYNPNQTAAEVLQKVSAVDWLKKRLNLDDNNDAVLLNALQGLSDREVENIFRYTLGKEVELFGQMNETKEQKGEDKVAINNTATARVAEHLGFEDVITKSRTSLVKFKRRDGSEVNQLCTICEEAPGDEFIDLMKLAEKNGVKVVYTAEAIRNLMRLQAIDTLCFQKDRHGRNFKCLNEIDPVTGNIIIKSIKAYDNDMSFDACSLEEGFKEKLEGTPKAPERNQFLPAMNMVIKKDSALYKHVMGTYFGVDVVTPIKKDIDEPEIYQTPRHHFTTPIKKEQLVRTLKTIWENYPYAVSDGESALYAHHFSEIKLRDNLDPQIIKDIENEIKSGKYDGVKYDEKDMDRTMSRYAAYKFADLSNQIRDIWFNKKADRDAMAKAYKEAHPDKYVDSDDYIFKTNLSDADKRKLKSLFDEMKKLHQTFDFTYIYATDANMVGIYPYLDAFMKSSMYLFEQAYGDSIENRALYGAKDQKTYDSIKLLMNKNGDLEIPSMLHYDREAYDRLCKSINDFEDPNSIIVSKLKKIGLSDDKIRAIAQRNREMKKKLDLANIKAQAFYKAAGWTTHPKNSFFLEKEDYKELGELTDFTVDPGNTYLAVDNENYLMGQTFKMKVGNEIKNVKYTDLMDENEILKAKDYNEYIKNDEKRWKYSDEDKEHKIFDVSNTDNKSQTLADPKEYIRSCLEDKIYAISHREVKNSDELLKKFMDAIFVQRIEAEMNKPVSVDFIRNQMEDDSDLRKAFRAEYNQEEGVIMQQSLKALTNKMFSENAHKKITSASFKKALNAAFDKSIEQVYDKIKDAALINDDEKNKMVDNIVELGKKMKAFAKKHNVELNIENAFEKYVQKNPNAFTNEQITRLKNGIKPAGPEANPHARPQGPAVH